MGRKAEKVELIVRLSLLVLILITAGYVCMSSSVSDVEVTYTVRESFESSSGKKVMIEAYNESDNEDVAIVYDTAEDTLTSDGKVIATGFDMDANKLEVGGVLLIHSDSTAEYLPSAE